MYERSHSKQRWLASQYLGKPIQCQGLKTKRSFKGQRASIDISQKKKYKGQMDIWEGMVGITNQEMQINIQSSITLHLLE